MKEKYYTNDVNGDLERAQDRITELEALIRDVAIPALLGNMIANEMRCDDQREEYEKGDIALTKLREAIK